MGISFLVLHLQFLCQPVCVLHLTSWGNLGLTWLALHTDGKSSCLPGRGWESRVLPGPQISSLPPCQPDTEPSWESRKFFPKYPLWIMLKNICGQINLGIPEGLLKTFNWLKGSRNFRKEDRKMHCFPYLDNRTPCQPGSTLTQKDTFWEILAYQHWFLLKSKHICLQFLSLHCNSATPSKTGAWGKKSVKLTLSLFTNFIFC